MKKKLFFLLSLILSLTAFANVAAATGFFMYEPEIPQELKL